MKFIESTKVMREASLYRDLDELEQHFLKEEIQRNHRRFDVVLRRTAKNRATYQRLKWALKETGTLLSIIALYVAVFLSMLVFFYQG